MGACYKTNNAPTKKEGSPEAISKQKSYDLTKTNSTSTGKTNIVIDQNFLVQLNTDNPLKNYIVQSRLGEGAFGTVDKVLHKETKAIRAMKKISKKSTTTTESEILNRPMHLLTLNLNPRQRNSMVICPRDSSILKPVVSFTFASV